MPRRGAAALAVTVGSLALLLSFRTPASDPFLAAEPARVGSADPGLMVAPTGGASLPPRDRPSLPPTTKVILGPPLPDATIAPVSTPRPAAPAPTDAPSVAGPRTATGQAMRTPYGNVQVKVTMQDGRIADIEAVQMPDQDRRSRRISQQAEPILRDDAISLQSARIHVLSGATYTSDGYAQSLQSALDQLDG